MRATFRYVLLTALRERMVPALLLALVVAMSAALFEASSALAEKNAFGLAFASEALRLILGLGLISFVAFHIRNLQDSREIEAILARPIGRGALIAGCFAAYSLIALGLTLAATGLIGAAFAAHPAGLLEWSASQGLESLIVLAIALFCAMSLQSGTAAVLAAVGFYGLARIAAGFRFIAENHTGALGSARLDQITGWIVKAIALVMPRLDLFGQSRWLIDGPGGAWGIATLAGQTALYVSLLLAATLHDLSRKRF